ncbi:presenilins-associated rhomboid-like protein, mitochondrial [Anneissia japonica]|uniref:presenilins-associated rhomboid-like protein, mitochondrial n=1 Tax=Anneissia japonica TaxID=1529436 RepID=UPI001425A70C|nr:presenilins-associated rhomboid-like protein, mitochondrial [Anneissia japonica]
MMPQKPTQIYAENSSSPSQPCRAFRRIAEAEKKKIGGKQKQKKGDIVEANFEPSSLEHFQVRFREDVKVPLLKLFKPFAFACLVTGGSFTGAAIWQYEGMRSKAISRALQQYSDIFKSEKAGELRRQINQWFSGLLGTQKVVLSIVAINAAVFFLWRVPFMQLFMVKWFSANPAANAVCIPMLLSTFSHYSLWHLAVNMYVLWTFSYSMQNLFGKEQFLAMYVSAGVWSSFASHLLKVVTMKYNPSLGASGAIMAVLGATCFQYPDAKLAIVFLPFFTFSAGTALKALIGIESLGIIMRWGFFDHAAHLSGLLFGCYYAFDGYKRLWGNRVMLMEKWHEYREKPGKV